MSREFRFHPSRRDFVVGAGALLTASALPRPAKAAATGQRLGFPTLMDVTGSRRAELVAAPGETVFAAGTASRTAGFNGNYLGPIVRVAQGETEVTVRNELDEAISSHWHGLVIPGEVDGGPHQPIAPGKSWKLALPVDQPAAPAWFHTHMHGRTAPLVHSGLAGLMQISDGQDGARGLPVNHGVDDLTLVLQDKRPDRSGRMTYDPSMHDSMMGFLGEVVAVNGQVGRTAVVPGSIVRLRLLNASNARIFDLSFASGRQLHLVATDGGYLPEPLAINRIALSPGERAEILVDFASSENDMLVSNNITNMMMGGGMMGGGMMGGGMMGSGTMGDRSGPFDVLAFSTDQRLEAAIDTMPDSLGGTLPALDGTNAPMREFSLDMMMGGGMLRGMLRRLTGGGNHAINGQSFDMDRIDFEVKSGQIERWRITAPMMQHPFHVHGTRFQVIAENGQPPSPRNTGWKDTVLVNGTTDILLSFDRKAPRHAPYMYHCHILEHEDGGMMGQFTVT